MNWIPEYPRTSFTYPSWPFLVTDEGPWSTRCLKHTIMLLLSEILTENLKKGFLPPMKHNHRSLQLYPAWTVSQSEKDWYSTASFQWIAAQLCPKPAVPGCKGDVWMKPCMWRCRMAVGGSAVPICFVERSALRLHHLVVMNGSGCIAKEKSLSIFTSCRD